MFETGPFMWILLFWSIEIDNLPNTNSISIFLSVYPFTCLNMKPPYADKAMFKGRGGSAKNLKELITTSKNLLQHVEKMISTCSDSYSSKWCVKRVNEWVSLCKVCIHECIDVMYKMIWGLKHLLI